MNEIELWSDKDIVDSTSTRFINAIRILDANNCLDGAIKWKNYDHQVVIKTNEYYYKVYTIDLKGDKFFEKIREKLAEIYRDLYGIHWLVKTIECGGVYYQVEQREALKVCTPQMISFEDLLLKWGRTLEILEEKLRLDLIVKDIQEVYPDVYKLKVIRDCVNKFSDYALTDDGEVILLDDSDWFIAMIDKDGNWLSKKTIMIDVLSIIGDSFFAPSILFDDDSPMECMTEKIISQWNIFSKKDNVKPTIELLKSSRETMLEENIKLLSLGKIEKPLSLVDYTSEGMK